MEFLKYPLKEALPNKTLGFTLIELLITIAIIGVLSQIAFASYSSAIQKSNRYEIQQSMIELSQKQERYYSRQGEYNTNMVTTNDSNDNYTVSFTELSENAYNISAVPVAGSGQINDECGTLTLNYLGVQTPTTSTCWK